jgi:asparagine synthase (glutamine-hydrolysing)
MCGIAGYYGPAKLAPERIAAALALMRRRGPDAEGDWHHATAGGRHVHLLHTRLAIIDLDSRANQPFASGSGVLSYNGEIYNYLELRAAFEHAGKTLHTSSDTEVLARILAEEGPRGLSRCEGMWGFAWFDTASSQLTLSRDRFGEKPLYFYRDGEAIYFGSEVKFLFALMGRRLPVNEDHLKRYLVNGYKALYKTQAAFFQGLEVVRPGHWLGVDAAGRVAEQPFWQPSFPVCRADLSYEETVAGTLERLTRSVDLRLRADVPVAFSLSGGVDSPALIAIAKRKLGYNVHGFTIMNTDARYEERDMVEMVVRELAVRHTKIPLDTTGFLPNLRELVRYHDAPVHTITYYAQWRVMQAVKAAGYKVAVSGTGADELFSGYYDHHNAYLAAMAESDPARYTAACAEWRAVVAPIVRNPYLQDPEYFIKRPAARDHIYLDAESFSNMLVRPWMEPFAEVAYTAPLLRNRMANELFHESVPVILHDDDLNAMYYSVENRSPYLDSDLFNWCQQIPTRHLVRDGRAKAVLRDAVRGIVPDAVINNPRKVGFNAPLFDYLNVHSNAVRQELLADGPIFEIVRRDAIETMLGRSELPNSQSKFLFNFVNARIFLEEFAA